MKFQNGVGSKNSVFLTLVADGTSNSLTVQLTMDPLDITFNNNPVGVSGPGQISFGGTFYDATYTLSGNPLTLNIALTPVGNAATNPTVGATASISLNLIYQG